MRQEEKAGKKKHWNKASGEKRGWTIWRRQTQKVLEEGELFVARLRCVFFRALLKGQEGFVGADFQWWDLHCLFLCPWGCCPYSPWWTRSRLHLWCCRLWKDSYNVDCVKFTNSVLAWKGSGREGPFYTVTHQQQKKKAAKTLKTKRKNWEATRTWELLLNLEAATMTVL